MSWPLSGLWPRNVVKAVLIATISALVLVVLARSPTVGQYISAVPSHSKVSHGLLHDLSQDAPLDVEFDDIAEDHGEDESPETNAETRPEDKIIVMGRLHSEDTSWVQEFLPDWQNAIYTVDNTSAPLHTPHNKGREANPYLLYIIDNYHTLPATIVFLHAHRDGWPEGWHNDAPDYDNVIAMKTLNINFVQSSGYVNLRCIWVPGCPDEVQYLRSIDNPYPETPAQDAERAMPEVWHQFFGASSIVPEVIAAPCCAQFAVSREQVHERPLEDYQKYHKWLLETPHSDQVTGLIFEYLWHVIFGKEAVYCPEPDQCYRDVYGR